MVQKAAGQYGTGIISIEALGEGLINRTFQVKYQNQSTVVLQCINQNTFPQPENIIANYRTIYQFLRSEAQEKIFIPALLQTIHGRYFWIDDTGNFWRATEYVENSYSIDIADNKTQAGLAAKSFGQFTRTLSGLDATKLNIIIKGFHDPILRYRQFEDSITAGHIKRLLKATHLIAELRERHGLVNFYRGILEDPEFKVRVMHHDAKISNILFSSHTDAPLCPVDLDTTMPGYFFSDLGDLIRSTTCTVSENDTRWEIITVKRDMYHAVLEGYLQGIGSYLSPKELEYIHHSGLLLTYLQSMRFLTDYLNNDIYYKTSYPEQNLNRALNQFIFLERLEEFLLEQYNYRP